MTYSVFAADAWKTKQPIPGGDGNWCLTAHGGLARTIKMDCDGERKISRNACWVRARRIRGDVTVFASEVKGIDLMGVFIPTAATPYTDLIVRGSGSIEIDELFFDDEKRREIASTEHDLGLVVVKSGGISPCSFVDFNLLTTPPAPRRR